MTFVICLYDFKKIKIKSFILTNWKNDGEKLLLLDKSQKTFVTIATLISWVLLESKSFSIIIYFTDSTPSTPSSPQAANLGEKLSVRRMLEVVRGHSSEESTKEINRRLQGLLEETLSKNMQLHQDVDNLSEQVHQLSILAAQKTQRETSPPADA